MDPFNALASLITNRLEHAFISKWLKFLFEIAISSYISYLVIAGGALVSGAPWAVAKGLGMVAIAISVSVLLRRERSGLTAGMLFVFPAIEAEKELNTDLQILQKPDKEK
jgi:hypothetical protein